MKPKQTKLDKLKHIHLSENERAILWMQIQSRKDSVAQEMLQELSDPSMALSKRLALMFSPVFAAFLLMVGSASALPGQQLYSFKTSVNEPLERLVTVGGGSEIKFETKLLNRRVNEARTLKAMGLLDIATATEIETTIVKQAAKVIDKKDKEKTDSNPNQQAAPSQVETRSNDDVTADVELAEFKGVATGSATAIRLMAGIEVTEIEEIEPKSIEEISQAEANAKTQSSANSKQTLDNKIETDPEVLKVKIQAEAKVATTKAEVAQELSTPAKSGEVLPKSVDVKSTLDTNVDIRQDVSQVTQKKIDRAKQVVDKNITEVDEIDLLDAVEQASAARTISEAFTVE